MLVKDFSKMDLFEPERCIEGIGFESIRAILSGDNLGFSLHKTIIKKGGPYHWHYKSHKEACVCVSGCGTLIDLETGYEYEIIPDMVYILDKNDDHTFEALEDTVLISVFSPAITGSEIHDKYGSYVLDYNKYREYAKQLVSDLNEIRSDYEAIEYITDLLIKNNVSI